MGRASCFAGTFGNRTVSAVCAFAVSSTYGMYFMESVWSVLSRMRRNEGFESTASGENTAVTLVSSGGFVCGCTVCSVYSDTYTGENSFSVCKRDSLPGDVVVWYIGNHWSEFHTEEYLEVWFWNYDVIIIFL